MNPNIVVICDGDRTEAGADVKDRVRRIQTELGQIPGAHIWITEAREIENYIPGSVLSRALNLADLPDPDQYENFFPRTSAPDMSYIERRMNRKGLDKMELAILIAPHIEKAMMESRFDWKEQVEAIIGRINSWNR